MMKFKKRMGFPSDLIMEFNLTVSMIIRYITDKRPAAENLPDKLPDDAFREKSIFGVSQARLPGRFSIARSST